MDKLEIISDALKYLSARCDHATSKDGQGFNSFDAEFGHSLARQAPDLTPKQVKSAFEMLQKYQGQLQEIGLELPDEIKEDDLGEPYHIDFTVEDGQILADFSRKPKPSDRALLDEFDGRRWNPDREGMPWEIPLRHAGKVIDLFGDRVEDDVMIHQNVFEAETKRDLNIQIIDIVETGDGGGTATITFGAKPTPEQRAQLDRLPERKWQPDWPDKPWSTPGRHARWLPKLFPDFQTTERFDDFVARQEELARLSRADGNIEYSDMDKRLFDFQKIGIDFIEKSGGRCLIADQMGLGKTIQALKYLDRNKDVQPALIVVPASLKINWYREIKAWTNFSELDIQILSGETPRPVEYGEKKITIINYAILYHWADQLKTSFKTVIADEAHYAKNSKAKRSKALAKIVNNPVTDHVLLMTGTPVMNKPVEMFNLLNMVAPEDFPDWWRYTGRYCARKRTRWGLDVSGASNTKELHTILQPYMLRRKKMDVLDDLPPKRRNTVVFDLTDQARERYNALLQDLTKGAIDTLPFIEKAKQAAAWGKLPAVLEWIDEFLETGEKLVAFAIHVDIAKAIAEAFEDRSVLVIGASTKTSRQEAIDRFQDDDQVRLFVGNIHAAGVGITLTAASDVAIVEFPWTPADVEQAIDRCHRIGQKDSVNAWYMMGADTIDEDITDLLIQKSKIVNAVMDGKMEDTLDIRGELTKRIRVSKVKE